MSAILRLHDFLPADQLQDFDFQQMKSKHFIQRPCYQRGSLCQDPAGNRTIRRPPDHRKETQTEWYGHVSRTSGLAKTILQGTVKGGRRQGRERKSWKTTSGNGQAWSSPCPRGHWRTGKNGGNWLRNHLWCPNDDDDDEFQREAKT